MKKILKYIKNKPFRSIAIALFSGALLSLCLIPVSIPAFIATCFSLTVLGACANHIQEEKEIFENPKELKMLDEEYRIETKECDKNITYTKSSNKENVNELER